MACRVVFVDVVFTGIVVLTHPCQHVYVNSVWFFVLRLIPPVSPCCVIRMAEADARGRAVHRFPSNPRPVYKILLSSGSQHQRIITGSDVCSRSQVLLQWWRYPVKYYVLEVLGATLHRGTVLIVLMHGGIEFENDICPVVSEH